MTPRTEQSGDWGTVIVDVAGPYVALSVRSPLSPASGAAELPLEEAQKLAMAIATAVDDLKRAEKASQPRKERVG